MSHGEIAIMTSGMITNGFSKEILKNYVEDEKTHIISVSYQDSDEIGGMIFLKGQEDIKIDGKKYEVKAQILDVSGFSGHAWTEQIQDIFEDISPEQIMIIHLNDYDKEELQEYYTMQFEGAKVIVPKRLEEYLLYNFSL